MSQADFIFTDNHFTNTNIKCLAKVRAMYLNAIQAFVKEEFLTVDQLSDAFMQTLKVSEENYLKVIEGKPIALELNVKEVGQHFRIHNEKNSMYTDRVLHAVVGNQSYFVK